MSEIVATIILSLLSSGVGALIWRNMGLGLMDEINPDEKAGRTLQGAIYGFIFVWGLYGIIHLLNWVVNL
jgi:UPF0716 family protein affecting phage T7 exclusion